MAATSKDKVMTLANSRLLKKLLQMEREKDENMRTNTGSFNR